MIRTKRLTSLKMRTSSDSVVLLVTTFKVENIGLRILIRGDAPVLQHGAFIYTHRSPGSKANNEGAGANDGGSRSAIALLVTRYAFAIDERCAGTA